MKKAILFVAMISLTSLAVGCAPTTISKRYEVTTHPDGTQTITESMGFTQAVEIPRGRAYKEVTEKLN